MQMGNGTDLVRRWFAAIDGGDRDGFKGLLSTETHWVVPGADLKGPDQVAGFVGAFMDAFPDLKHELVEILEGDGNVVVELVAHGTHTGPLRGAQGEVPPTGNRMALHACNVQHHRDGQITRATIYFDQMELLGQLGLLPGA
jgi:steroid delta-isomerase-like uncharacterized protein